MQLIICEKASLAKNVKNALADNFRAAPGYYEGTNYIVSYAAGHLLGLREPNEYPEISAKNIAELPFCPHEFEFKVIKDNLYNTNVKLIHRKDVTSIVHCGDADRAGELIIRNILDAAENTKPVYRLWLPAQTPEAIREALHNMPPDEDFDNLANEELARTYADWLFGMNLSRYLMFYTQEKARVGRVIIPIVKAVYDRDMEIRTFKVSDYFTVTHTDKKDGIEYSFSVKEKYDDKFAANIEVAKLNRSGPLRVISTERRKAISTRPKLFSLSKLQAYLAQKYKMPMKTTLASVQALYDNGFLTYPRTNTEYLATSEKEKVKAIIELLQKQNYSVAFRDVPSVFDDSKIESHSALTPTNKLPSDNDFVTIAQSISKGANNKDIEKAIKQVYQVVLKRFCAVFCVNDCVLGKSKITFKAGTGDLFTLEGTVILEPGYLEFEPSNKEKQIPRFDKGDTVEPKFATEKKQTTPPKHYTVSGLMNFLKNPFKKDETDEDDYDSIFKGIEIGTEATRTGIIENAKTASYISEKNGIFYIEPLGEELIHTLDELGINIYKEKSVELNQKLKAVNRDEMSVQEVIDAVMIELNNEIDKTKEPKSMEMEKITSCPLCDGIIYEAKAFNGKVIYQCSKRTYNKETKQNEGCNFMLWKSTVWGHNITHKELVRLCETGKTDLVKLKSKKTKKSYEAYIKMNKDNLVSGSGYVLELKFPIREE